MSRSYFRIKVERGRQYDCVILLDTGLAYFLPEVYYAFRCRSLKEPKTRKWLYQVNIKQYILLISG